MEELYWDNTFEVIRTETHKENGVTVAVYSYDVEGTLTSVTEYDDNDTYVTIYSYFDGNVTQIVVTKNGLEISRETYTYDSDGNQVSTSVTKDGKTIKSSSVYSDGRLTSYTDSRNNTSTLLLSAKTVYAAQSVNTQASAIDSNLFIKSALLILFHYSFNILTITRRNRR